MNAAHTKKLFETFPYLYRGKDRSIHENLMPFGFEHGDGWFQIIWDLSENLTALNEPHLIAMQVKEKFGTLRFYVHSASKAANKLIHEAEALTHKTCELCGKPGEVRNPMGWVSTECDACWKKSSGE